jgi:dihydrofolate reductase
MKAFDFNNQMNGIGLDSWIPWKSQIATDYFNAVTTGSGNNAVVMGCDTFKSMNFRPFANRRNYVITMFPNVVAESCGSDVIFEAHIANIRMLDSIFDEVFVIGGGTTYKLFEPFYTEIYMVMIGQYTQLDRCSLVNLSIYEQKLIKEINENDTSLSFFYCFKKT